MQVTRVIAGLCALVLGAGLSAARADELRPFPQTVSFTTLIVTPLAIEGLTGDADGNLYTTGREASPTPCPVWRINLANPSLITVGLIPNPVSCNPSGITFDRAGNLYIADAASGGVVWKLTPSETAPPTATAFATGVPGTNGLAFDRTGNLWTGDGTTGQGRVWRITPAGSVTEVFRIQPMRNSTALGGDVAGEGVGRQARTFPPGALANSAGGQDLVANGLAFTREGDLYIADTARGAIWQAAFDRHGNLKSPTNCDTTFTPNTLCLDNIFVAHPYLEGTDGIALDQAGNIWNSANERNAIIVVTNDGRVAEVFRTPVNASGLRNSADTPAGNQRILEFPASPFLLGKTLCTSNSDGDRRDNSPRAAGEINGGAGDARGKISCMDQDLLVPGLPLPVR